MGFTLEQTTRLITLIIFAYWEPYSSSCNKKTQQKYEKDADEHKIRIWIPATWFGPIWFVLKALVASSFFLYMEYTLTTDSAFYLAVVVLFIFNVFASKYWMPLFFAWNMRGVALVLSTLLMSTAWGIFVLTVGGWNLRNSPYLINLAPAILWMVYASWLTVAWAINIQWWVAMCPHRPSWDGTVTFEQPSGLIELARRMAAMKMMQYSRRK